MNIAVTKLPGKGGYACKIFLRGRHVATVANPHRMNEAGAREAAYMWHETWKDKLFPKGGRSSTHST